MDSPNPPEGGDYRPAQRKKGRRAMLSFEVVNTFSFSLLAGNLITLLMLRLDASSTLIGVLSAFPYLAFLFMPLAKQLVPRWGLVKTWGISWTGRYTVIAPIVVAPFLVAANMHVFGIVMVMVPYLLFQIMRGFGLVSISPLNNELSAGRDRGEYLSRKSMVVAFSSIAAGLLVSFLLGSEAPIERYSIFMGLGVVLGFIGSVLIFRIPEPPRGRMGARSSFFKDIKEGFADRGFRRFVAAYASFIFITGLGRPFLIVYAKQVYAFGDNAAMILTVVGSIGAIAMAWLSRMAMDRLGAKPMMIFWNAAFLVSVIPIVFLPPFDGAFAWVFLIAVFLFNNLGGSGGENASQAYFFAIVKPHQQFNLGMLYYLIMGLTGAAGSFFGGLALDLFTYLGGKASFANPPLLSFNIYYGIVSVLTVLVILLISRMAQLGARPVGDALQSIFSPRDLRTMDLLRRLEKSESVDEEERMMRSILRSDSDLAVGDMLKRLSSPIYAIRSQALLALEKLPFSRRVEDALIHHVNEHQFASAYRAARILGDKGVKRAAPVLRQALKSEDYLLQAYAAGALGELRDLESRAAIEDLVRDSDNVLVLVHAIDALKDFSERTSIPYVLATLSRRDVPAYLRDEIVFGLAGILKFDDWLYPKYLAFLEKTETGLAMLLDEVDSPKARHHHADAALVERRRLDQQSLHRLVNLVPDETEAFALHAGPLLSRFASRHIVDEDLSRLFTLELEKPGVRRYIRYRFFVAAFAVRAWVIAETQTRE